MNPDKIRIWVARLAAPVAFFLAATVLVVLVQRALETEDTEATPATETSDTGPTTTQATTPDGTTTSEVPRRCRRRNYVVRQGDTLESIADVCQTTVEALTDLNPDLDPLALSPGQRIRLR